MGIEKNFYLIHNFKRTGNTVSGIVHAANLAAIKSQGLSLFTPSGRLGITKENPDCLRINLSGMRGSYDVQLSAGYYYEYRFIDEKYAEDFLKCLNSVSAKTDENKAGEILPEVVDTEPGNSKITKSGFLIPSYFSPLGQAGSGWWNTKGKLAEKFIAGTQYFPIPLTIKYILNSAVSVRGLKATVVCGEEKMELEGPYTLSSFVGFLESSFKGKFPSSVEEFLKAQNGGVALLLARLLIRDEIRCWDPIILDGYLTGKSVEMQGATCAHCGKKVSHSFSFHEGDVYLCQSCSESFTICPICHSIIQRGKHCTKHKNIAICKSCGERFKKEDMIKGLCYECDGYHIFPYSTRANSSYGDLRPFQVDTWEEKDKIKLFYGMEIEVEDPMGTVYCCGKINCELEDKGHSFCRARQNKAYFKFFQKCPELKHSVIPTSDSSLENEDSGSLGTEFKTVPASYHRMRKIIKDFSAAAGGIFDTNPNGGVHIHFSRAGFTSETIARLVFFINDSRAQIERIADRKYNHFCSPLNFTCATSLQEKSKALSSLSSGALCHEARYNAVNLTNRDTIELRIFNSTTNEKKLLRYLEFASALIKFCGKRRNAEFEDLSFDKFKEFVKESKEYTILEEFLCA